MMRRVLNRLLHRRSGRRDRTHRRAGPRTRLHVLRLLAVAALLGPAMPAPGLVSAQAAAQTWDVQVGFDDDPMAPTVSTQAFYPAPLVIRAGDTVKFNFAGFHTVTFNSGRPPLPLLVPGSTPGELQLGPAFFPAGPTTQPVRYDGTQQLNSGAPLQPPAPGAPPPSYSVTFTQPGLYGYTCEIHPGMRAEIEVVPPTATLPETPAQANTRGQATMNALVGKGREGMAHVLAEHVRPGLGGVQNVFVGSADPFGASVLRFLPGDVSIRRGDIVVWSWADPFEVHTVTFTSGATPPEFVQPRPQPQGPPLLVIPANVATPQGGNTYSGQGYLNSGIFEAPGAFAVRFDAPAGSYEYLCLVHPSMRGRVTVTG